MKTYEAELFERMALNLLGRKPSDRLEKAIQEATERAQQRGENPQDYIAGAIEDKLNQNLYALERAQDRD